MTTGAMGTAGAGATGAGATGAGATGGTGAGATGAAATGATGATGAEDPRIKTFKVPEKFAKESWANEVKSVDDLWEKMNGAQKLIGKDKIVLPGENATSDELTAFYERMGRPKNPEGYEFKSIESLKEITRNADLDHGMKKILFENGVSKEAGEKIVSAYEEVVYTMHKPAIDASAERNLEFQKLADEVLGDDKVASMEAFKSVMREALGEKAYLADKIEGMSNEELLPLIVFSKNIHDKYVGENTVLGRPGGHGKLTGDLKTDFQTLSAQKLEIKNDKNMAEHIKKMKLANLNLEMQRIGTKANAKGINLFE